MFKLRDVFIELNTKCNFNCDWCVYPKMKRPHTVLTLDRLQSILAQLNKYRMRENGYIMFSPMGEPLIYPQFLEACDMVAETRFPLVVTTNGSLLSEKHHSMKVQRLYISFRSLTAGEFEQRHTSIPYEEYTRRVVEFVKDSPLNIIIYLMGAEAEERHNYMLQYRDIEDIQSDEMRRKIEYFARLFCPSYNESVEIKSGYVYLRQNLSLFVGRIYNWANQIMPNGWYVRPESPDKMPTSCDYYDNHVQIYSDGSVTFCCMDNEGILVAGNIFKEPLEDILERRDIEKMRNCRFCRVCKGTPIKSPVPLKWD